MAFLTQLYGSAMQHPYGLLWTGIGFFGQTMFALRFVVQWLSSERAGHSVIPIAFWYFSIFGTLISFGYAVHMQAWPLLLGYCLPLPIYVRNLVLVYRDRRKTAPA